MQELANMCTPYLRKKGAFLFLLELCQISTNFTCVSYAEARLSYRLDVRLSVSPSVCLSVCPSHADIVSKRLNILSCFLRHTIAHSF